MICIECTEPVQSLYTQYSPSNIRLTACPRCNKFADKYIEYDNVLIFVDVILLKPQAYRHLVFNVLTSEPQQWGAPPSSASSSMANSLSNTRSVPADEMKINKNTISNHYTKEKSGELRNRKQALNLKDNGGMESNPVNTKMSLQSHQIPTEYTLNTGSSASSQNRSSDKSKIHSSTSNTTVFSQTSKFIHFPIISGLHVQARRMWLLVTLFDVYLTWVRAEQNRYVDFRFDTVLELPVLAQYTTFFVLCVAESLSTYFTITMLAIYWLGWKTPNERSNLKPQTAVTDQHHQCKPSQVTEKRKEKGSSNIDFNSNSGKESTTSAEAELFNHGDFKSDNCKNNNAKSSKFFTKKISFNSFKPKFLSNLSFSSTDPQTNAAKTALSTALLISSSSKLFPILMVIWSYDTPFAATVLGWAVSFNTVEVLMIILQCGYITAGIVTATAALVRTVICDYFILYLLQMFWKFVFVQ